LLNLTVWLFLRLSDTMIFHELGKRDLCQAAGKMDEVVYGVGGFPF